MNDAPDRDSAEDEKASDVKPEEATEPAREGNDSPQEAAPDATAEDAPVGAAEAPTNEEKPKGEKGKDSKDSKGEKGQKGQEAAPGAELEPIALEPEEEELDAEERARREADAEERARREAEREAAHEPIAATPAKLSSDARFAATGKRKASVARVILEPGNGAFKVNDREAEDYFPRAFLRTMASQPLTQTGYGERLDVRVRVHGGGISGQAAAIRHGIARALCEVDPALRPELKRRGMLTRDARVKERRKAGLKKARKRPQFSKR